MSIALNHITLSYGSRTLLEDVTAAFAQGSLTALIGRNGTGKSTLLRAIAGLGTTVSGDVALCGRPLASLTPHELSTTVGFVTTDKVRIANLACEDVVALGRGPYGCADSSRNDRPRDFRQKIRNFFAYFLYKSLFCLPLHR